jgi:hypothetical protein
VADLASFIAAPSARILSDFGADVIKAVPSPHSLSCLPTKQKKKGHAPSFGTANARTRQDICVRCDLVGWRNTCPACAAGSATGTNRNTDPRSRECASQCSGGVANRGDGAQSRRYRQTRRRLSDTPHEVREWIARQKQADNPPCSCCGEADAYFADAFEVVDGKVFAIITDDRGRLPVTPPACARWHA